MRVSDELKALLTSRDMSILKEFYVEGMGHAYQIRYNPFDELVQYFTTGYFQSKDDLERVLINTLRNEEMANIFQLTGDMFTCLDGVMLPKDKMVACTILEFKKSFPISAGRGKTKRVPALVLEGFEDYPMALKGKTLIRQIAALHGADPSDWIGSRIFVYRELVESPQGFSWQARIGDKIPPPAKVKRNPKPSKQKSTRAQEKPQTNGISDPASLFTALIETGLFASTNQITEVMNRNRYILTRDWQKDFDKIASFV